MRCWCAFFCFVTFVIAPKHECAIPRQFTRMVGSIIGYCFCCSFSDGRAVFFCTSTPFHLFPDWHPKPSTFSALVLWPFGLELLGFNKLVAINNLTKKFQSKNKLSKIRFSMPVLVFVAHHLTEEEEEKLYNKAVVSNLYNFCDCLRNFNCF